MLDLKQAIEAWIKAEYIFRLGPHAYQTPATEAMIAAEQSLRAAVTGQGDLGAAADRLGYGNVIKPRVHPIKSKAFSTSYIAARAAKSARLNNR